MAIKTTPDLAVTQTIKDQMFDDIAIFSGKLGIGHGAVLLTLGFGGTNLKYQKSHHVR